MKCIDCKFCAFINESTKKITVTAYDNDSTWDAIIGAYCMKTACYMIAIT